MVELSSKQAILYASAIFLLSAILNYIFPYQSFSGSGFVVSIFLTIFINKKYSTHIVSFASLIAIFIISFIRSFSFFSGAVFSGNVFILVIIVFSAWIVLYIKRLLSKMQYDKSQMTSLFENATEGIILSNRKGKIVLVNPSAQNIFGYTEEELAGELIEVLIPARFKPNHDIMRKGFYEHPQNRQMGVGRDLFGRKKNGIDFPVEVSLSHYKQNNEDYVIAFIVDITARKNIEINILRQQSDLETLTEGMRILNSDLEMKVEQRTQILTEALQKLEDSQKELNEALDKEKELNEIKSRFVSMASHEFRTPLSTILSSASLLSKYALANDQDKRDKHISRIKNSVKILNDILEEFLSLGKLDEGKISVSLDNFDLQNFLKEILEEMETQTKAGQKLNYIFEGNSTIYSDKKLFRNIVTNLISNAMKFSGEGKTITIDCNVTADTTSISVIDEGIGISEEDRPYLFSSFFRGKNALNIEGTGLGLHIVKRHLELLNGTITLESGLLKGTTFTIALPV